MKIYITQMPSMPLAARVRATAPALAVQGIAARPQVTTVLGTAVSAFAGTGAHRVTDAGKQGSFAWSPPL